MGKGVEQVGQTSLIEKITARVVAEGWCRPPLRVFMYNNFGPVDDERTPSSTLLFLFQENAQRPEIVVKLNRERTALQVEYKALCTLQKCLNGLAPAPLFSESFGNWGILGMRNFSGKCLSGWDERVKALPNVVERLLTCHLELRAETTRPTQFLSTQEVSAILNTVDSSPEMLKQAIEVWERVCSGLTKAALPCVPQHGDFCFPNILLHEHTMCFLDWEDYGEITVPSYDVFCLLLNLYVPDGTHQEQMFFQDRVLLRHARQSLDHYFQGMGISKELISTLFEYTLIQQVLCSYQKKRSSTGLFVKRLMEYLRDPNRFGPLVGER